MINVVAAVIRDGGEYLACRRTPERGSKWEFPGGKVEHEETLKSALRREILEELGVEITVGAEITVVEDIPGGIRLHSFDAHLTGPRPVASTDHDQLLWCAPSSLSDLDWSKADLATVIVIQRGVIE